MKSGNINPGIDTRVIKRKFGNIYESRSRGGGHIYFKETDNVVEIIA